MTYTIGIDLGGTNLKAAALDVEGRLLEKRACPTGDFLNWSREVKTLVRELESARGQAAMGVGITSPGVIAEDGLSVATTSGKKVELSGLDGLNWTLFLGRPGPVPVLNDAHAALVGEAYLGAAAGFRHVLLLTLGTGVGGAIIADGRLLRGWRGIAGHLGHVCLDVHGVPTFMGTPGALELEIGDCTIMARSGGRFASTRELVAAYRTGDAAAGAVWLKSVHALACAIASFINILDPEAIVIGGGIAQAGEALFQPLREEMEMLEFRMDERRVRLLPAQLGEWAGAYGAARTARAWATLGNSGSPLEL